MRLPSLKIASMTCSRCPSEHASSQSKTSEMCSISFAFATGTMGKKTPFGYFEYRAMLFGLTTAPIPIFHQCAQDMLNKLLFVYLDDIPNFLDWEIENSLFVEKCEFHVMSTAFLGFIIQQGQLSLNPTKIRTVAEWQAPTNRKQLQQFSAANFMRIFICNYSRVAAPMT